MEPRPFRHGNVNSRVSGTTPHRRFNGATSLRTWKRYMVERVRLFCYDASNLNIRLPLCPVLSSVFSSSKQLQCRVKAEWHSVRLQQPAVSTGYVTHDVKFRRTQYLHYKTSTFQKNLI